MTSLRCSFLLLMAAVLMCGTQAQAQTPGRMTVSDLKPLLKLAVEHGSAHGILVGEAAAFIRQKFNASAPIEIDVRSIQALRDPGCSRLEITTRQVAVLEKGKREDKVLSYQLNYCRDGRIPERS
jgi:hypothetical protein